MWTYTAYILYRYWRDVKGGNNGEDKITFKELSDFIFKWLWLKYGVCFHDSQRDLFYDLLYLKELGIIEIDNEENYLVATIRIRDKEKLEEIARTVEQSYAVTKLGLYRIYKDRIDKAIKSKVRAQ